METKELILPSFLASALINGDLSSLDEGDLSLLEQVLEATKGWNPVDVGDSYFDAIYSPIFRAFTGDIATYTFLKFGA